jgi:[acyl-carrier-protein] S-malonyltransferase
VSGEQTAIEDAMAMAKPMGAKLAVRLPVGGAFHSPLMQDAAQEMSALLDESPFQDATMPVYPNTTATATTKGDDLRAALKPQMTGAVRWTETVQAMRCDGASAFHELGPGNVLTGLVKRIEKGVEVVNVVC